MSTIKKVENFHQGFKGPTSSTLENNYQERFSQAVERLLKYPMERKVVERSRSEINKIEAISSDPQKTEPGSMWQVSDVGPALSQQSEIEAARDYFYAKRHVPAIWRYYLKTGKHPPYHFDKTSFVNYFSTNTLILYDIYRPPWKPYYTSDVILYQWLKALGKPSDLNELPQIFPTAVYINNITNIDSKAVLNKMLNEALSNHLTTKNGKHEVFNELRKIPHLKCVVRVLEVFNLLNASRNAPPFHISAIQIYREREACHLRIEVRN